MFFHEKDKATALLEKVADFIRRAEPRAIEALLSGKSRLAIVSEAPKKAKEKSPEKFTDSDLKAAALRLYEMDSRDLGDRYIRDLQLPKQDLERLARHVGAPVQSEDTRDKLVTKIVETTIGFRIRSEAIRTP